MKKDRVFDGLSQHFYQRIYAANDPRGAIRLHIAQDDLVHHWTALKTSKFSESALHCLDAGGGLGQMSVWLAKLGHQVVLAEPSGEMLAQAELYLAEQPSDLTQRIQRQQASIQQLLQTTAPATFDGIILHAVLEWLAEPQHTIQQLLTLLKPQGMLSLLFFNQHSIEMRQLLAGDFAPLLNAPLPNNGERGLIPISPCTPEQVLKWLPSWQVELLSWSGVRCFYDYTYPNVRQKMALEQLLVLERRYSQREPWRSLARYQHFLLQKQAQRV